MHHTNRVDFTGQTIYVGIDIHKKNWIVSNSIDTIALTNMANCHILKILLYRAEYLGQYLAWQTPVYWL